MTDRLDVPVHAEVQAVVRRASSHCHAAKLSPGAEPGTFTCRECGQPCTRILSDPEAVTFHG